jgi:O-antigen ligase
MDSPVIGHGLGMADVHARATLGYPYHQSFLLAWYDSGIVGLACFISALLVVIGQGFRNIIKTRGDPQKNMIARLWTGIPLGLACYGFVEGILCSSTNFVVGTLLISFVVNHFLLHESPVSCSTTADDYDLMQPATTQA